MERNSKSLIPMTTQYWINHGRDNAIFEESDHRPLRKDCQEWEFRTYLSGFNEKRKELGRPQMTMSTLVKSVDPHITNKEKSMAGEWDRPKEGAATVDQIAAWDKGYTDGEADLPPTTGGLYRGEENYYIQGYNRNMVERGKRLYRLSRSFGNGLVPVPEENLKISDEESKIPAGEVRTTSSTGGQKGVKPERYSLIPVEALASVARLYAFGAIKYAAHNWRLGYEWTKSYDSLFRHANASMNGEDIDEETGEPHLAGVVFHAFTLMTYLFDYDRYGSMDDRYKAPEIESGGERLKEGAVRRIKIREKTPEEIRKDNLWTMGLSEPDVLMQEYEGKFAPTIEDMIDYLAAMYDGKNDKVAKALRLVSYDLRNDKNRNIKSFDDFREKFSIDTVTKTRKMLFVDHEIEIEPVYPQLDTRSMMLTIPIVVGAVYYRNDRHVIGSFHVRQLTEIKALALPGYRFVENATTEWTFIS